MHVRCVHEVFYLFGNFCKHIVQSGLQLWKHVKCYHSGICFVCDICKQHFRTSGSMVGVFIYNFISFVI